MGRRQDPVLNDATRTLLAGAGSAVHQRAQPGAELERRFPQQNPDVAVLIIDVNKYV